MAQGGISIRYAHKYSLQHDVKSGWVPKDPMPGPIPLTFELASVDRLVRELTDLSSERKERVAYLGYRPATTFQLHKAFSPQNYEFIHFHLWKNRLMADFLRAHYEGFSSPMPRIFTGMNPTMAGQNLKFDSHFEGGNLDLAVKLAEGQYDLYIRADSNTRGFCTHFNFKVSCKRRVRARFAIVNFGRAKSLYQQGMRPYISTKKEPQWRQTSASCLFIPNPNSIGARLQFQHQFQDSDEAQFAFCVPYSYSRMLKEIATLEKRRNEGPLGTVLQVSRLCFSLSGVQVPLLTVGKFDGAPNKHCVVITARVHPGQSNSSFVAQGLLDWLCGDSKEAVRLRERVVFKVVPMLNPDGVILGNSRTGVSGRDLNREFQSLNKILNPEVHAIRQLVKNCKLVYGSRLLAFIDLHGHSARRGVFAFGPDWPIFDLNHQRCRVLLKLLSLQTPMFRFHSCNYQIPEHKSSTARAVVQRRLHVPNCYTIESSLDSYFDQQARVSCQFTPLLWEQMGRAIASSICAYNDLLVKKEESMRLRVSQRQSLEDSRPQLQPKDSKEARLRPSIGNLKVRVARRRPNTQEPLGEWKTASDQFVDIDLKEEDDEYEVRFLLEQVGGLPAQQNQGDQQQDDSDSAEEGELLPTDQFQRLSVGIGKAARRESKGVGKGVSKSGQRSRRREESPRKQAQSREKRLKPEQKVTQSHKMKMITRNQLYTSQKRQVRATSTRYFNAEIDVPRKLSYSDVKKYVAKYHHRGESRARQEPREEDEQFFFRSRLVFLGTNIRQHFEQRDSATFRTPTSPYHPLRRKEVQPNYQSEGLQEELRRKKSIRNLKESSPGKKPEGLAGSLPRVLDISRYFNE